MKHFLRVGILTSFTGVCLLLGILQTVSAQDITQGYSTDESLRNGMLVGLDPDDASKVSAVNNDSIDRLYGVVADPTAAPFALSDEDSEVQVAIIGKYYVLVTDSNGPIKSGDNLSTSSLSGFAQKSSDQQAKIVGKSLQDFIPSEGSQVLSTSTDSTGASVNIGKVLAYITVAKNPDKITQQNLPGFLSKAGESVANKPVSPARLYVSLLILVIVTLIAGSLIYSSVRSSITAIGRNPLSKRTITKSLIQVVTIAFLILLSGLFAVYLILKVN